jgi:hypothetical protein
VSDLDALVKRLDQTADAMREDLAAAGWAETEDLSDRWRSPDRKRSLPLAAAWELLRTDTIRDWRGPTPPKGT